MEFIKSAVLAIAILGTISTANASLVEVDSRAGLAGTDFIDWSRVTGGNPVSVLSNNGMSANVSIPSGALAPVTQGVSWGGNFGSGDALLWTRGNSSPITIVFGQLVSKVGTQFQADYFGAFTALIEVFDINGVSLGSFTRNGTSTGAGDNSAIFLGAVDTIAEIKSVQFSLTSASANVQDFSINQVALSDSGSNVPEPASLALLSLGLAGLGLSRRKNKQQ